MKHYRLVRREHLNEDGWTGGDWRQFIAFMPNGSAFTCRMSDLPFFAGLLGAAMLAFVVMVVLVPLPGAVEWGRVLAFGVAAVLLLLPGLVNWLSNHRLVVQLSLPMWPDADGVHWRRFDDDDEDDDRSWWDDGTENNLWPRQ